MLRIHNQVQPGDFKTHLADCVIRTHDGKIMIQKRPENWGSNAGGFNLFGGHVEQGETIIEGLIRELKEETGADVPAQNLMFIGTVSEDFTGHTEAVHIFFWQDAQAAITGCYEAEAAFFDTAEEILRCDNLMEYAAWALKECRSRGLIQ